jgi:hypothetical protein
MSNREKDRGVFLYDEPSIDKLKSCALFWKSVVVYEGYLTDVDQQPELVQPTLMLLKAGILKICVDEDLQSSLYDKIYTGLDKELWEYLYKHANKISVRPQLPENAEEIVAESTKKDSQDQTLQKIIDQTTHAGFSSEWMNALKQNERIPFDSMDDEFKEEITKDVNVIVDMFYSHFFQNGSPSRFGFEQRNRYLLEQMSVSSSIYAPTAMLPYYSYKLGDYSVKDARKYLNGLNAIMPFVKKTSIDNFSLTDVLEIRRKRKWDKAMVKLSELCTEIKSGADIAQFSKELELRVISEYQDALDEASVTWKDLAEDSGKNAAYTGISFIPVIGPIISTIASAADPVVSYFRDRGKQRALPVFLNDLRKFKSAKIK